MVSKLPGIVYIKINTKIPAIYNPRCAHIVALISNKKSCMRAISCAKAACTKQPSKRNWRNQHCALAIWWLIVPSVKLCILNRGGDSFVHALFTIPGETSIPSNNVFHMFFPLYLRMLQKSAQCSLHLSKMLVTNCLEFASVCSIFMNCRQRTKERKPFLKHIIFTAIYNMNDQPVSSTVAINASGKFIFGEGDH